MIVDNGAQVHLVIEGVFDGTAGYSRGQVAFIPNKGVRPPGEAVGGIMDGVPVRLVVSTTPKGPFYSAKVYDT